MAKFIPVEPEKWAEMVKAWAENVRLETENAQLQTELAHLKAEVENSKRINTELLALSNRQASTIRSLTKAGDEMHEQATNTFQPHSLRLAMEAWNAAKKGGQP